MERFLVLTTTTDERLAKSLISTLELNSIEVILEHVEITDGNLRAAGYRVLAPAQKAQTALNIVESIQEEFFAEEAMSVVSSPREEAA